MHRNIVIITNEENMLLFDEILRDEAQNNLDAACSQAYHDISDLCEERRTGGLEEKEDKH